MGATYKIFGFFVAATSLSISSCLLFGKDEICCPLTGCFNKDPPFQYFPLPQCAEDFKINYTMYTRESADTGEKLDWDIIPSKFNGTRRTVFVAHGYVENADYRWMTTIKDAFLKRENINVVIMDWSKGGSNLNYLQSASNTRTVGAYTALVIQNLLQLSNTSSLKFWGVGHSLGSHVVGHLGMRMPADKPLGRVTGLDPAGPGFESNSDLKVGINPSSASFVDILHTSTVLGTKRRLGHIDFYPSGYAGKLDLSFDSAFELGIICGVLCTHKRSVDFMIASLRGTDSCFATDKTCDNEKDLPGSCHEDAACVEYMGYRAEEGCKRSGIHFLVVPPRAPFCTEA